MNTVRKLLFAGDRWRFENVPAPETSINGVHMVLESVLLPPKAKDAGLWVGYDARLPTARYAGWGPLMDHLSSQLSDLLPLSEETSIVGALSLPACAIAEALDCLMPVTRVAVVGEGLLATLVKRYLAGRVILQQAEEGAELDLVVDTTGEPSYWSCALPALRGEGTLLLLVPPWSRPTTFNFYPYLHRRSLRVVAQRWHLPPPVSGRSLRDRLCLLISSVVQEGRWVRPLDLEDNTTEVGVWRWINWSALGQNNVRESHENNR